MVIMKLNKILSTSIMTDCGTSNTRAVYTKSNNPSVLDDNILPFNDRLSSTDVHSPSQQMAAKHLQCNVDQR